MNSLEINKLIKISEFPEKGSAVLCYFHERGEVSGEFYVGLITAVGKKEYSISWSDGYTETLNSISGDSEYYKYYSVLGYLSFEEYKRFGGRVYYHKSLDKFTSLSEFPSLNCIKRYNKQLREIKSLKKNNYSPEHRVLNDLSSGLKIKFIYINGLCEPEVLSAYTRRKESDKRIYVNMTFDLSVTDNDEEWMLVKNSNILSIL